MQKLFFVFIFFFTCGMAMGQKKPLDHSVYDGWQSIGDKLISRDGNWIVYTIDKQEGDRQLVIESASGGYKKTIDRGTDPVISSDSKWLVFTISPFFSEIRNAKIKKKKADDSPKDSIGIVTLGKDSVWKRARVKGFSLPEKSTGWLVYQLEKKPDPVKAKASGLEKKKTDSLTLVIDSLKAVINGLSSKKQKRNEDADAGLTVRKQGSPDNSPGNGYDDQLITDLNGVDGLGLIRPVSGTTDFAEDNDGPESSEAGTDLVIRNLETGREKTLTNVNSYLVDEKATKVVARQAADPKDTLSGQAVILYDFRRSSVDTISYRGNDFKNFVFSEDGSQLAFVAERDARPKELMKYYKLWYYKDGQDSAVMLVDKSSVGMTLGMTVSEFGKLEFSKSGNRLFFNTAPVTPPKDTTLVDIDLARLDVWHYKDDYLQPVQLSRLTRDLQQNYLAVYDLRTSKPQQLATEKIPLIFKTGEGDGDKFIGISDYGMRIEGQWTGNTKKDLFQVDVKTGEALLVKKGLSGVMNPSYISTTGKYVLWYDYKARNYFLYSGDSTINLTSRIKTPLFDEEHDSPSDPTPYGVMGWHQGDSAVYIVERYDIWKISLSGPRKIESLTRNFGRRDKNSYYPLVRDSEKKYYSSADKVLFRKFNSETKEVGFSVIGMDGNFHADLDMKDKKVAVPEFIPKQQVADDGSFVLTKESFVRSPDIYLLKPATTDSAFSTAGKLMTTLTERKLSSINPQQKEYNWGTAELYKWKTFKGKPAEGIIYKPEDFNPSRKYPVILYFYEKLSDGLYNYIPPAPTPSRLNISFFVSRGYIVFAPDISYTIGHPALSAYDYIVSAAKDLTRHTWVDAGNMGIQGQSWGGIQVAQLVTMTDMFKAAWAGAPVANMTSAYGGIRWESGVTRQFQYEQTQSRIGATLWQKPELYMENSPLFHLPKVKTPLVIMANDADGAVPWYQGIELFTGMRRLNKKVWMLNYNGEAHNLVQRKNRKDIQIREQQYFDWLLKGAKPAVWITDGVPAVKKGKDWGLNISDSPSE
ncbi:MAG: prolyl oligopeptidase family serine peptidase [Chitinophagaceae bacterium]